MRRVEAIERGKNNDLRTAWKGEPKKRPKLHRDERKIRVDRQASAPRHGWPNPTISFRLLKDAQDPDRAARLAKMTETAAARKAAAAKDQAKKDREAARRNPDAFADLEAQDIE